MKKNNQMKVIDWEQRRYELAKKLLPVVLVLDNIKGTDMHSANEDMIEDCNLSWYEMIVSRTLCFVDEMLRQLKHNELNIDLNDEEYYRHIFD